MVDGETLADFTEQLRRLNHNMEAAHNDSLRMSGEIRTLNEQMRMLGLVAKRLGVFNGIMLQVRKAQGASGMIAHLLRTFAEATH